MKILVGLTADNVICVKKIQTDAISFLALTKFWAWWIAWEPWDGIKGRATALHNESIPHHWNFDKGGAEFLAKFWRGAGIKILPTAFLSRRKKLGHWLPCPAAANGCQTHTQYWFVPPTKSEKYFHRWKSETYFHRWKSVKYCNWKLGILDLYRHDGFRDTKLLLIFYKHKNTARMSKATFAWLILYCEQSWMLQFLGESGIALKNTQLR